MTIPLLHDAIDLVRLRVAPPGHYRYPPLHLALALLLLGTLAAAGALSAGAKGEPVTLIALYTAYVTLETVLYSQFMSWWLRHAGAPHNQPLFGLIVAANGLQLLEPLSYWLPDDLAHGVTMVLALGGMLVLINALARVSGTTRLRVLGGTLLFAPLALALLLTLLQLAAGLGQEMMPPLATP